MSEYFQYLRYIIRHKWFVFVACCRLGIIWRGITHDLSKLRPSEFIPYARYFYGNYPAWDEAKIACPGYSFKLTKEGVAESFDFAWLLHQKRNPHHWQWWILPNDDGSIKTLRMSALDIKEMVADWIGAGMAISGRNDVVSWYRKNQKKMVLNDFTRRTVVEELLHVGRIFYYEEGA